MTVLVTGAHGAIGSWVVRELVRREVPVVALDIAPRPTTPFPELARAALVVGDVRDREVVAATIRSHGVDRVLHLAAIVGGAESDPIEAIDTNGVGTARVLDAAAEAGVARVVAMSTKGVLGPLEPRYLRPIYDPVPVDLPPSPRNVYEATKYLVDIVVAVHRGHGLDAATVRLGTTWGPGKSGATHGAFSVHSDVLAAALRGESSRLDVHPDQGHDLVYYADIAAALAGLVLAPGRLGSPAYHVGSGRITTVGEYAAAVEAAFPGVRVETGDRMPSGRNCLMDISLIAGETGYAPAWDVPRALADIRSLVAAGIVSA